MSVTWKQAYSELKEFIAKNPQIEIGMNVMVILDEVRPEFYRLFNATNVAILKEKCQILLDEAFSLSRNYTQVAQQVTKSLGLSEIKLPINLSVFLSDPVNALARPLFDLLFCLLKGAVDIDDFEHQATEAIEGSFKKLFQSGYEKWVLLSLVTLLAPEKALAVPIDDILPNMRDLEPDEKRGNFTETVPTPKKTELLSFERDGAEPTFILSDIIVNSTILGRYVSIGTDLADAFWTATQVSDKREWHHLRQLGRLYKPGIASWPDMVVYIDDQPENIGLVADFVRFCRPDIIVECMEQEGWYDRGGLERVKQNHDFLKPRLGSYVVSRFPVPEEAFRELMPQPTTSEPAPKGATSIEPSRQEVASEPASQLNTSLEEEQKKPLPDIHILTVGYDQSQLVPIIEALLQSEGAAAPTDDR